MQKTQARTTGQAQTALTANSMNQMWENYRWVLNWTYP